MNRRQLLSAAAGLPAAAVALSAASVQQKQLKISGLETEEPNLEHAFLHLTGRALRD